MVCWLSSNNSSGFLILLLLYWNIDIRVVVTGLIILPYLYLWSWWLSRNSYVYFPEKVPEIKKFPGNFPQNQKIVISVTLTFKKFPKSKSLADDFLLHLNRDSFTTSHDILQHIRVMRLNCSVGTRTTSPSVEFTNNLKWVPQVTYGFPPPNPGFPPPRLDRLSQQDPWQSLCSDSMCSGKNTHTLHIWSILKISTD